MPLKLYSIFNTTVKYEGLQKKLLLMQALQIDIIELITQSFAICKKYLTRLVGGNAPVVLSLHSQFDDWRHCK